MATKMKMVNKGGKIVPAFAADGKGKMKMGGTKKYDDGGGVTRGDIKNAKREAKLKRIEAGTEPSGYEKVANITGNVAKTAASAAQVASAVKDARSGMGGPGMKKGGAVKKYQTGGASKSTGVDNMTTNTTAGEKLNYKKGGAVRKMKDGGIPAKAKKVAKAVVKASPEYKTYKAVGKAAKGVDDALQKRYPNYTGKGSAYDGLKQGVKTVLGYKTGGMVNSNAKATVLKTASGRPAKSAEPRTAAKRATGRVGGISKAPRAAAPKMKMGGSMRRK